MPAADTGITYDAIIVGSGVSGSFMAWDLTRAGMKCLMLEAGHAYTRDTYPKTEMEANAQLYWAGGLELNTDASLALLRPKVVGGGSVVNQALVDRFDDVALDSWREASGVSFFESGAMAPWYDKAESEIVIQEIPADRRNRNARIFQEGFDKCGFRWAPLRRAQRDCRYDAGNDCIVCLAGCPIESKQSMPVTTLKRAIEGGLKLTPDFEALRVATAPDGVTVTGRSNGADLQSFRGTRLVLAAGAIGNSKLLLQSGFRQKLPAIGRGFYTHPQLMNFGVYDEPVDSHKGAFQSLKSADPGFRKAGFKLENVYGPPVAIAMLLPGFGRRHLAQMKRISHYACIEVAVRDTNPGRIRVNRKGDLLIEKSLNAEDRARAARGLDAVNRIFSATGAREIINSPSPFGLHLMGGCAIGTDPARSVVDESFRLHGHDNVYIADSSIFPNAPGINPSLTIMALGKMAAAGILGNA